MKPCKLIHSCLTVSSLANARLVFEDVLGCECLYTFEISAEIINTLFHVDSTAQARVYNLNNANIEVFILDEMPAPGKFQHLCLECSDRSGVLKRAADAGFEIRRFQRTDGDVIFAIDHDKNLFELKAASNC